MVAIPTDSMTSIEFIEHEKTIDVHGATLSGTLCLPVSGEVSKVVLMVPGSGEVDRNENMMQLQLNTFNALAHTFSQHDIASLRFDKRGCASSGGKYHDTGFYDFVDDANHWLLALSTFEGLEKAGQYVLGHSEGALIAGFLSAKNPELRGQVLLTPMLENVEMAIERQLMRTLAEVSELTGFKGFLVRFFLRLSGNQLSRQRKIMKRIKNTNQSSIKIKKTLINAKWLREVTAVDASEVYAKTKTPTLAIGGEKDLQCLPEDTQKIAQIVGGPVEAHLLSNLTHILRYDDEQPSTFRYKKLSEDPIDVRVPELILDWIKRT